MKASTSSKTAIVTGGRGLIGHAIIDALQSRYRTKSVGRSQDCDIQIDLANEIPDFSAAAGGFWIHAAGATDEECKRDPEGAIARAALATPRLVDAAVNAGVKKLVYISSAHVYGPLEGNLNEASPINPLSLYAQCHFVAEQAFRQCARKHGKPVLLLRPCAVYGMPVSLESFGRWSLIPYEFPRSAIDRRRIVIRSSGLQSRNFVSTQWIAEKVRDFLQYDQRDLVTTMNPIGADHITVRDFARRCGVAYSQITDEHCDISWVEETLPTTEFTYTSIHDQAFAKASQLDDYLHDILTRLAQHALQS